MFSFEIFQSLGAKNLKLNLKWPVRVMASRLKSLVNLVLYLCRLLSKIKALIIYTLGYYHEFSLKNIKKDLR